MSLVLGSAIGEGKIWMNKTCQGMRRTFNIFTEIQLKIIAPEWSRFSCSESCWAQFIILTISLGKRSNRAEKFS